MIFIKWTINKMHTQTYLPVSLLFNLLNIVLFFTITFK